MRWLDKWCAGGEEINGSAGRDEHEQGQSGEQSCTRRFSGAGAQSIRRGMVRCEAGERDVSPGSERKEVEAALKAVGKHRKDLSRIIFSF